jgi:hypothetical protein
MTSVAVPVHPPFQQEQTTTSTYYENIEDAILPYEDEDTEMTNTDKFPLVENGYDDQDTYNADILSTVVEPPQSDAVLTHAPSTILDEMEYLDEVDYEEDEEDPASKIPDIHLVHETDTYKVLSHCMGDSIDFQVETTPAHTPPSTSLEDVINQPQHVHPSLFSPSSRMIPLPRASTPHLLATATITTSAEDERPDDDWPIFLCTPTGQEYMLFRSDGDTEALFEDSWLKSQSLETFFSSIRQTLESELASLTTSFAMDEIVLAIPDLDVSIAEVTSPLAPPSSWHGVLTVSEDNCYTREISLQDLVNLINDLCVKNGTERSETCKLYLSLQPRFIARFNQLVSLTSQTWDSSKQNVEDPAGNDEQEEEANVEEADGGEGEMIDEDLHEGEYIDYEGEDIGAEVPEYEDEDHEDDHVKFVQEPTEGEDDVVEETQQDVLTEAEEEELFEENDEILDPTVESREALVNEDDDVVEVLEEPEYEPQQDDSGEEHDEAQLDQENLDEEEQVNAQEEAWYSNVPHGILSDIYSWLSSSDSDDGTANDDDDLISYEEAVDQTEDGQDYRQQFLSEQDTSQPAEEPNGLSHKDDVPQTIPLDNNEMAITTMDPDPVVADVVPLVEEPTSDNDASVSKRPLDEVVDPSAQDQAPRKLARFALSDDVASKRAKS